MKKPNKNIYDKVMDEFNSDNITEADKSYSNIKKIYDEIKEFYKNKINNEEMNIKFEKIRIEEKLGKYSTDITEFGVSYFIVIFGNIFYFMIQDIFQYWNFNRTINFALNFITLAIFLVVTMKSIGKDLKKESPKGLMLNISLKVLDELECAYKNNRDNNLSIQEVAATEQDNINKKNNRKDDRVIKGFINIVNVKKS